MGKPVLFISHAATDKPIVNIIKAEVDRVFANGVEVFASTLPGAIRPGADWLQTIRSSLERARAVAVLITPVSLNRPWIWFELGASWSKMADGRGVIYPLCVPEIGFSELPEPLRRLQALSLARASHMKQFFQALCDQFGFGNMKGFKGSTIKNLLPKYADLEKLGTDLDSGTVYTGPYAGYSSDELKEVLAEYLLAQLNQYRREEQFGLDSQSVFAGKLIHFRLLDGELRLPPGASRQFLKEVASRFSLHATHQAENTIRFSLEQPPTFTVTPG